MRQAQVAHYPEVERSFASAESEIRALRAGQRAQFSQHPEAERTFAGAEHDLKAFRATRHTRSSRRVQAEPCAERSFVTAEVELAAHRAKRAAATTLANQRAQPLAEGLDYGEAAADLNAFREAQAVARQRALDQLLELSADGCLDERPFAPAAKVLASFRTKRDLDTAAAVLEHQAKSDSGVDSDADVDDNEDRDFLLAVDELAECRGKATSRAVPEPAVHDWIPYSFVMWDRNYNDAELEMAATRVTISPPAYASWMDTTVSTYANNVTNSTSGPSGPISPSKFVHPARAGEGCGRPLTVELGDV
jgi:hypothetical protein